VKQHGKSITVIQHRFHTMTQLLYMVKPSASTSMEDNKPDNMHETKYKWQWCIDTYKINIENKLIDEI